MMVRINLLPGRRRSSQNSAGLQLIAVAALLLIAELVICWWLWSDRADQLARQSAEINRNKRELASLDNQLRNLPNVQAQRQALEQRKEVLVELTAERIGPQHILDELKFILNRPQGKLRSLARAKGWNLGWDADNVIIDRFFEDPEEPSRVIIEGQALHYSDVSEFWARMKSSDLFSSIQLPFIRKVKSKHKDLGDLEVHSFRMTAYANFRYRTRHGFRLVQQLAREGDACSDEGQGE